MVPSGLMATPASPPLFEIDAITAPGANPAPATMSLVNTVGVEPPAAPIGAPVKSSFTASMLRLGTTACAVPD